MRRSDAEQLRRDLLALSVAGTAVAAVAAIPARAVGRAGPAVVVPERLLFRVNAARLPVAILLSRTGVAGRVSRQALPAVSSLKGDTEAARFGEQLGARVVGTVVACFDRGPRLT